MSKILYCPMCGKSMIDLGSRGTYINQLCRDSKCRCMITMNKFEIIDIEEYSKFSDIISEALHKTDTTTDKYYMLTKENSSQPALIKNTNSPYETKRQTLSIIKCKNKKEALAVFKEKFKVIKITEDRIIEVTIKEG